LEGKSSLNHDKDQSARKKGPIVREKRGRFLFPRAVGGKFPDSFIIHCEEKVVLSREERPPKKRNLHVGSMGEKKEGRPGNSRRSKNLGEGRNKRDPSPEKASGR